MQSLVYRVSIIMDTEIVDLAAGEEQVASQADVAVLYTADRNLRWFELILVLLVALGNFFLINFSYVTGMRAPVRGHVSQNLQWTGSLLQEAIALLVLGYVLGRRKLRLTDLGVRWSFREIGAGFLVTIASYVAYTAGYAVLNALHRQLFGSAAQGTSLHSIFGYASTMMVVFSVVNPFFEELIVRAYLMTEIKHLTGSWPLAALVSTAVQTSYHLYYGWTLALALGCQFLVFSIYYARTRRATPLVFAHGVFDLIGVVQLI